MRKTWSNLGCLIISILLLPVLLIVIGPLFVLAALRGQQPLGPITLNTSRYGPAGRVGALMLGLALWLLVWSALAWIAVNGILPSPTIAETAPPTPTVATPLDTATHTPRLPTLTPSPRATPTETSLTPTPAITLTIAAVLSATPTPTPASSVTPTPQATVTITNTAVSTTATLSRSPTPTSTPSTSGNSANPARLTLLPTITAEDRQAIIIAVDEGNNLLREAIISANTENLDNLKRVWQGRALTKAEKFAVDHYIRYAKPLQVEFEYITEPTVGDQSTDEQAVVTSQETWRYGAGTTAFSESLEFIYTLIRENDAWLITSYAYRNLPDSGTPTPRSTAP